MADDRRDDTPGGRIDEPDRPDERTRVRRALREVRRERLKAAAVYAVVDGVAALLVTNLALSVVAVPGIPATVGSTSGSAAAGLALGLVIAGVELAVRTRSDAIVRFERFNAGVETALRTARDSATAGRDTVMSRQLYADVLDRLGDASSRGFLDARWLAVRMALIAAVSLASVHVAVVGLEFSPAPPAASGATGGDSPAADTVEQDALGDPDSVLGDPENVTGGTDLLAANVSTGPGGGAGERDPGSYDDSGFSGGDSAVSAQRAGYDAPGELDDADLIREYNVRINEADSDD
ncbi:MAG: hypothetical protein ABEI96_02160 [Haloarculaceae archaeon]